MKKQTHGSQFVAGRNTNLASSALRHFAGYTLIELIVAVGLFSLIMALSSGAYLMMIGLNRQAQGVATGINDLSFALETMTRDIRTGSSYGCVTVATDCESGGSSFVFTNNNGVPVAYSLSDSSLRRTVDGVPTALTNPDVSIEKLTFYVSGSSPAPADYRQSRVTIVVTGTVSSGAGKTQSFTVETGATMRGSDI